MEVSEVIFGIREKKLENLVIFGRLFLPEQKNFKGTNPALKNPSNIPEIYAKMFGRFH